METTLIDFATAKLAKEKGFDRPCLYGVMGKKMKLTYENPLTLVNWNSPNKKFTSIPTQSLLQKWLREEKKVAVDVACYLKKDKFQYVSDAIAFFDLDEESATINFGEFDSYELALEFGMREVLKLIK